MPTCWVDGVNSQTIGAWCAIVIARCGLTFVMCVLTSLQKSSLKLAHFDTSLVRDDCHDFTRLATVTRMWSSANRRKVACASVATLSLQGKVSGFVAGSGAVNLRFSFTPFGSGTPGSPIAEQHRRLRNTSNMLASVKVWWECHFGVGEVSGCSSQLDFSYTLMPT